MNRFFQKVLIAVLAIIVCGASSLRAQSVNMDRYMTITVKQGASINFSMWADAADTQVKIVSGSNEQTIPVDASWTAMNDYVAGATTIKIYGNVLKLNCFRNGLNVTGLDVSHNTQLQELNCYSNGLTSLDISGNTQLELLSCYDNKLTSLNLSNSLQLTELNCQDNSLTSLDVSRNTKLKELYCYKNSLTSLVLGDNSNLEWLYCFDNSISKLDLSKSTQLERLFCYNNSIATLDLSHNTQLQSLNCYGNKFTTASIDDIYCSLPDRKGKPAGMIYLLFNASSADKDKVLASNGGNATNKNWEVKYYESNSNITGFTGTHPCGGGSGVNTDRYITLTVKERKQIWLNLWADAADTQIKIVSGSNEKTVTVGDKWTEWKDYTAGAATMTIYGNVQKLDCSNNNTNITSLDASHNAQLQELLCYSNSLTSLDLSRNTQLKVLGCFANSITSLDVSHNAQLTELDCSENKISSLDVSKNTQLVKLFCLKNSITTLDVSHDTQLTSLNCSENKISSLDVSKNVKLEKLHCNKNTLTSIDVSKNLQLTGLDCSANKLKSIDVSKNTVLEWLYCFDNSITSLDVKNNTQLKNLRCYNNSLASLDVSKNTELEWLYCYGNSLASIDISKNTQLKDFVCYGNKFTTASLDDIYCSLPDRNGKATGIIRPVLDASAPDNSKALASNGKNASDKNWKIVYYKDNSDITGFTGTHQCGGGTGIDETKDSPALAVYPNPVKDVLNIATDKPVHSIRIYNVYGTEVAQATDTDSIDLSHLPAGVYMVRADGKVTRIIKK